MAIDPRLLGMLIGIVLVAGLYLYFWLMFNRTETFTVQDIVKKAENIRTALNETTVFGSVDWQKTSRAVSQFIYTAKSVDGLPVETRIRLGRIITEMEMAASHSREDAVRSAAREAVRCLGG